ncbi:MAG: hypothetical protein FWE40_07930 [Oscillospiraceae bacterium]|nr:hypothetical protein [Oscillospiraceae bacterium]
MQFPALHLLPEEQLLLEGVANQQVSKLNTLGGQLYLTSRRLVFTAHSGNIGGARTLVIPLSDIAMRDNSFEFRVTSNWISYNLYIKQKSGAEVRYVVTKSKKTLWIDRIAQALAGTTMLCEGCGAVSAISLDVLVNCEYCSRPKTFNPARVEVMHCKGCGAFVVVTGSASACDYCTRRVTR